MVGRAREEILHLFYNKLVVDGGGDVSLHVKPADDGASRLVGTSVAIEK